MPVTDMETDVRTVVATEIRSYRLDFPDSTTALAEAGFNVAPFIAELGLGADEAGAPDQATLTDVVALLEAHSEALRDKVWGLATEARLERLLQGTILATGQPLPPYDDRQVWWYDLVTQVLWWFARQDDEAGMLRVRNGASARAIQSLTALGVLELDVLAEGSDETARTMVDTLKRCNYPVEVAQDVYVALGQIASKVVKQYDGRLQRLLRPHADRMVKAVSKELLSGAEVHGVLSEAVRTWLSHATGLPVFAWSPSTSQFIQKFAKVGVDGEMLARMTDVTGLPAIDGSVTEFMDRLCRDCDPENEEHQYCVKQFALVDWQVECPARPDLAALAGPMM